MTFDRVSRFISWIVCMVCMGLLISICPTLPVIFSAVVFSIFFGLVVMEFGNPNSEFYWFKKVVDKNESM